VGIRTGPAPLDGGADGAGWRMRFGFLMPPVSAAALPASCRYPSRPLCPCCLWACRCRACGRCACPVWGHVIPDVEQNLHDLRDGAFWVLHYIVVSVHQIDVIAELVAFSRLRPLVVVRAGASAARSSAVASADITVPCLWKPTSVTSQ